MNFTKLPDEIICHISGYYGKKIPTPLSREIKEQRLLQAIKENEYYNVKTRTWHNTNVFKILSKYAFMTNKINLLFQNDVWKDKDKIINLLWWSYSSQLRKTIIDEYFPYANNYESTFITGRELIKSHTGYYII